MKTYFIFSIFFLTLLLSGFVLFRLIPTQGALNSNSAKSMPVQGVSDSIFPFQELTIPYLRNLTYGGILGDLKSYQSKATYNSYLTSYTAQGVRIDGLLTIPKGETPTDGWPAIIFVHGYIPPTVYRTTQRYIEHVDYLARNGFVVFKIDLRGHGNSEGEAEGAYYSSGYVIDVLNAYETIRRQNFVNPNRVGLWGHSMAGNILLRTATVQKNIPAVVIWAGAVYTYEDFLKYRIQDNSYRPTSMSLKNQEKRKMLFSKYGEFSTQSPFWAQVSPTQYLSDISTRFSLHHAQNDTVVDIGYSRDLRALLASKMIEHEFFEYPRGGHNLTGSSFNLAMKRTIDFFKQQLK